MLTKLTVTEATAEGRYPVLHIFGDTLTFLLDFFSNCAFDVRLICDYHHTRRFEEQITFTVKTEDRLC